MLWRYGIKKWFEFFSDRQLLTILVLSKNLKNLLKDMKDGEKKKILMLYLSFIISKLAFSNPLGLDWNPTKPAPGNALTFRQPRIIYNHAEINPFEKIPGSISNIIKNITIAIKHAVNNKNKILVLNKSITKFDDSKKYDLIITESTICR